MGLTQSSPMETHLTVASILLTPLISLWSVGFQPNFPQVGPMTSCVPKAQPYQAALFMLNFYYFCSNLF